MENPVVAVDVMADPPGNPRVWWISFLAFSLGFLLQKDIFICRVF